jgi:hypothetical protein
MQLTDMIGLTDKALPLDPDDDDEEEY